MKYLEFLTLVLFTSLLTVSCNSDDDDIKVLDGFHPNGIKMLDDEAKVVTASTYAFNTDATIEITNIQTGVPLDGIEGEFFQLNSTDGSVLFIQAADEGIGNLVFYQGANDEIFGGNSFEVNEDMSTGFITVTGEVTGDNEETRNIAINVSESQIGGGTSSFEIQGNDAILTGSLGTYTFNQILEINANPSVNRIVLQDISGSNNDDVNVLTGRLVRNAGYTTHVPATSEIASGGVDLFTAGVIRTRDNGGKIGVHAWCCTEDGGSPADLPTDSPEHDSQLSYFRFTLGDEIGPMFYFFTINAAPTESLHFMTPQELSQFNILTN